MRWGFFVCWFGWFFGFFPGFAGVSWQTGHTHAKDLQKFWYNSDLAVSSLHLVFTPVNRAWQLLSCSPWWCSLLFTVQWQTDPYLYISVISKSAHATSASYNQTRSRDAAPTSPGFHFCFSKQGMEKPRMPLFPWQKSTPPAFSEIHSHQQPL